MRIRFTKPGRFANPDTKLWKHQINGKVDEEVELDDAFAQSIIDIGFAEATGEASEPEAEENPAFGHFGPDKTEEVVAPEVEEAPLLTFAEPPKPKSKRKPRRKAGEKRGK